ncbi:MAG: hypothetical protein CMF12_06490 [Idiomarina sp.]|jgi:ABC-2 type transport system permease protein|uniref:ABC transporter permease n=1 Tax=Idiomarina sp. TaxID=1874361 RepID=UPI000C517A70|nr:ABC transporter permease [Idiomarina sp.]MAK72092.1 hypothetical protein [Idiomarinaceae bacterium]MBT42156.1 hypothetical protein [Idiomarina sp.]
MRNLKVVFNLGIKELVSLSRDPMLLLFIVLAFTVFVYTAASATPQTLHKTPIAVIDNDRSPLSQQIISAFIEPYFLSPQRVTAQQADSEMDQGRFTFIVTIPSDLQRDVLANQQPEIQVLVDATRMSQAFTGNGYIQAIIQSEVARFTQQSNAIPIDISMRTMFNEQLDSGWFSAVMELINQITMLSIILTGAALLREREHGTIEHLMVMPITPLHIMLSKVWSMGVVVLLAASFSLLIVIQQALAIPVQGSPSLFLLGTALHLFATTSIGIFMGTFARTMPQFGLLFLLVILPMQILSGGMTPFDSMPTPVQWIMSLAPTSHYTAFGQSLLFRGAGFSVVWPQLAALLAIGLAFFVISWRNFQQRLAAMA